MSDTKRLAAERRARMLAGLARRRRTNRRLARIGLAAVGFSALVLVLLLGSMVANGIGGFQRYELRLELSPHGALALDPVQLEGPAALRRLDEAGLPLWLDRSADRQLGPDGAHLLATTARREVAARFIAHPALLDAAQVTMSLPASDALASAARGTGPLPLRQLARTLGERGVLVRSLDWGFFTRSDATSPQAVGIWGALKGTMLTMAVTLALAFPVGVLAAIYLEEYAPRNRWTELIAISISNLAAVPSILFGLLGLVLFLGPLPQLRSAPLIGGMTLALMTMPVIVIASRSAIRAVPSSIRDAARAIGASPVQVVLHHVLPLALPGILTGAIIGMSGALGETAPLLLIGMKAFLASPPLGITHPATVLPVQIFLWSDEVDRGFVERTSAAIVVLLGFLLVMNGLAIYLRNRFEQRG